MANEQKRDTPAKGTPQQSSPEEERPRRPKETDPTPEDAQQGYSEPDVGAGEK